MLLELRAHQELVRVVGHRRDLGLQVTDQLLGQRDGHFLQQQRRRLTDFTVRKTELVIPVSERPLTTLGSIFSDRMVLQLQL